MTKWAVVALALALAGCQEKAGSMGFFLMGKFQTAAPAGFRPCR